MVQKRPGGEWRKINWAQFNGKGHRVRKMWKWE